MKYLDTYKLFESVDDIKNVIDDSLQDLKDEGFVIESQLWQGGEGGIGIRIGKRDPDSDTYYYLYGKKEFDIKEIIPHIKEMLSHLYYTNPSYELNFYTINDRRQTHQRDINSLSNETGMINRFAIVLTAVKKHWKSI